MEELSDPEGEYAFTRPDAERFETAVGELGIDNETTVVVYDSAVGQWAARVWWLFRAFGHDRVAVLDGGLAKWRAEGRELETGHIAAEPALFEAHERAELWVDKEYVAGVLRGDHEAALVCATPAKEFSGEVVTRVRAGHIPGSTSTRRRASRRSREPRVPIGRRAACRPGAGARQATYRHLLRRRNRRGVCGAGPDPPRRDLGRRSTTARCSSGRPTRRSPSSRRPSPASATRVRRRGSRFAFPTHATR